MVNHIYIFVLELMVGHINRMWFSSWDLRQALAIVLRIVDHKIRIEIQINNESSQT